MTSFDKDIIARGAKGELFVGKDGCALQDFPDLREALRHENYEIRGITPPDRLMVLCQMLLRDDYNDVRFAD